VASDAEKIAELNAIVEAVRERVRGAHRNGAGSGSLSPVHVQSVDLMPIVHARDAAQAKVAAIGSVNPRAGGLVNKIVQTVKKTIARSLQWFVRDQIVFNRESITALEATIEALTAMNRDLLALAAQTNSDAREVQDIREHWIAWRSGWEQKLAANEIQLLRTTAELQSAFQHRATLTESNFREIVQAQHRDYLGALDRYGADIQKRLWADLEKVREQYERMIHAELRLIRLRAGTAAPQPAAVTSAAPAAPAPAVSSGLDYSRFAERFRGTDEEIRRNMEFYRPIFAGKENVLDIGCGRGEFLDVMREAGVPARGIDLSEESIQQSRDKGLRAEVADLFPFLGAQPDEEFDGILSSQVVEHLPPDRLPEMIRLCAKKLRRGGILALETPNPECLAIFATYFYLDPTHTRPMPHQYLQFCMEEAGLTGIEVHRLNPAVDTMPELASLPADFRERFFGGLDYAIIGRKI
jgi:2-polyprenyl-3-methyl-5-hydroxy-6-metoxy-1,4-benzoquinol methylase